MTAATAILGAILGVLVTSHLHKTSGFWAQRLGHTILRRANLPVGGAVALVLAFIFPAAYEPLLAASGTMGIAALAGALFDPLPAWEPSRYGTPAAWVHEALDALTTKRDARVVVWAPSREQARIIYAKLADAGRARDVEPIARCLMLTAARGGVLYVLERGQSLPALSTVPGLRKSASTHEVEPYPDAARNAAIERVAREGLGRG